jgi:hypothetical protein
MASAPSDAAFLARLGAVFATPPGRILRATLVGAVAFLLLSLVVRQARAAVHRIPMYRIDARDVVFLDVPAFADDRMRAGLRLALSDLFPSEPARLPSLYDAGLERRLREILGGHPMLREIEDIDVRFPSEVRVRASIRAPLARFRARVPSGPGVVEVDLPVDPDGVVLDPDVYGPFLGSRDFVRVRGVEAICPGVGARWTDRPEQVAEGLEAARIANRLNEDAALPSHARIVAVDVSGFPATPRARAKGEVFFVLQDGRRISWGRTERDLSGVVREDSYEVKRERLLDLHTSRPASDRRDLDVRFPSSARAGV